MENKALKPRPILSLKQSTYRGEGVRPPKYQLDDMRTTQDQTHIGMDKDAQHENRNFSRRASATLNV